MEGFLCIYLLQHLLTNLNLKRRSKKKGKKREKRVSINRKIRAYFRAAGVERDIKAKLTNSELIIVKSSGNSYSHFVGKNLKRHADNFDF